MAAHRNRAFIPAAPKPRSRPAGRLGQIMLLARNPLETWTERHFEMPILHGPSLIGNLVAVNDPALVKRVLVDNAANYPKDPLQHRVLAAGNPPDAGRGLLSAEGELWKRTRRTLAPLFSPRRVAGFAETMRARAESRVERWLKRRRGAILEIDREMTGVTYDILSATLFSDALAGDAEGVERELVKLLDTIGRIHPFDLLDAPEWLPRIGQEQARRSRLWFDGVITRLIGERNEMMGSDPAAAPDDLLTALMKARDPETGEGMSDAEIAANLFTFIAAGHETTARALGWTLYLLAHAPDWLAHCEAEADAASSIPALWLDEMPALRAVLDEALRLYPPVPHMSRVALARDRLGDVDIPARSTILIAPWVIHRHRLLWDRPDAFRPQRFMPGEREKIDRFAYLPFGAGPRICIGASFAIQEAMIVLVSILRRVRLRHTGEQPVPVHRITLRPKGRLTMAVTPR